MSSTRRAKDDSVFHQHRYASSGEFERGLLANLVAKRTAILDDKQQIELIWFIHYLSHQPGSLAAVATDVLANYRDRIQTKEMAELKLKHGRICSAELVKKLRDGLVNFPLKGERYNSFNCCYETAGEPFDDDIWTEHSREEASQNPTSYPSDKFFDQCQAAAEENLEKELAQICLDPKYDLKAGGPWYFPRLIETLREYQGDFVKTKSAAVVVTAFGAKVHDVLDYTFYSRGLTLIEGNPRLGKSFAARSWCRLHPGQARFVEVPPSNDEASFFRALARGLGIGNFLQYKVTEIRERVQSVLFSGDLLLVLDEAHRLWPQRNMRYGCPSRINWVMSLANETDDHPAVPIAMISTPQFIELQKAAKEKGLWNSAQLTGRIAYFESLPTDLEPSDLMAVAQAVLPEANSKVLRALAVYARSSERYLAAIEAIAKRAHFIAMRDNRKEVTTADLRKAMQESVIPADAKLLRALETGRRRQPERTTAADDLQQSGSAFAEGRQDRAGAVYALAET
ncbi:MAG TPA: ATP-binding protein [Verrucomicrobiae bacterium]|nr:ATP-binding protein [Verrucomicrobiae bacterium]HEV2434568.1 ATP-binding protein [Verrucomicrobiae bacterium]